MTTCLPADPDVAVGGGYVFEVANSAYRIWTSVGSLIANATLDSLFGTGADVLASPQVQYDPTTLRWFASVEDVSRNAIEYGCSETSDPTGSWFVQQFMPGGGDVPTQPTMAVDSINVVISTNIVRAGTFLGAQIWVANKTQLEDHMGPMTWNDLPSPANESLIPANPSGASGVMYLVTDGTGGTRLNLSALSGTPPTMTLSAPVVFPSTTTSPPAASQLGTSNLVDTGTAQVQSAVWQGGTLWASANVACTPPGDTTVRSCLHLWELSTVTDLMLQDFNWTAGAGTYSYFPAVAVDAAGDVTVVFEESSAASYPGIFATAQTPSDALGSLEPMKSVRTGSGPDNASGKCSFGTCPFGNYSGAAVSPLESGLFWVVGEYSSTDFATDYWHTWVRAVSVTETFPVTLTASNLPAGTTWTVTVNGVAVSSNDSTILLNESNGGYTYSVASPIAGAAGSQFVATPVAGSFSVASAPVLESINFTEQFALTTSVTPSGAGTISPATGWFNASAPVTLSALAGPGHAFASWLGSGAGSYTGADDPTSIVMDAAVTEQALYSTAVTFSVTFAETGLPTGTSWTVVLNGVTNSSAGTTVAFNEPNGTYAYYATGLTAGSSGTQYVTEAGTGSFNVSGSSVRETVPYTTQFELTTSVVPAGAGTAGPVSGWYDSGARVELSALASPGYQFDSWVGSGTASYSGVLDPYNISIGSPVTEQARFSAVTPSTSSTPSPLSQSVPLWVLLAAVGALVVLLAGALVVMSRRRGPPRPPPPLKPVTPPGPSVPPAAAGEKVEPWSEDGPSR